ncbi:MAG: hypothetical protein L0L52_06045 [Staphylococcus equorum]|uniref:hypothetical protein n=1 Tax=Staphylococcus TaxID=1279 RepID=UPI0008534E87|nr:hypothetical protein [Staphylococcus equorum]MDG0821919.1 hypothetical protein [Staphylococcus equorum]MDG0838419.1 hypothetical protein [Staphylococcus equorum]MDK9871785.1 hypothetical protein [Staphylococcus equorum]MDK9877105.1 hypothetical protein [Staphylococcus equorum]MDN5828021.1 hypothetical protein [Staphylococcus equorum]
MHYCLKDGHEEQEIIFIEEEVVAYNQYFNQRPLNKVPPLYCAKLWPEFQLFQQYANRNILLKETEINYSKPFETNETYLAYMCIVEKKKIKSFTKYIFKLEIHKNSEKYITIKQTFLEQV